MGDYNPHTPIILGQEWVPIRNVDLTFNEALNSVEVGTGFTLASARQVSQGRFYVNEVPKGYYSNQAYTMSVYQRGMENATGPVQRVVIPCNNGGVTGSGVTILLPATTVAQALANPGTDPLAGINIASGNSVQNEVDAFFAVDSYAIPLSGKRILGVNFLINYRWRDDTGLFSATNGDLASVDFGIQQAVGAFSPSFDFDPLAQGPNETDVRFFKQIRIGDVAMFYGSIGSIFNSQDAIPWTFQELQRFEATYGVGRISAHFQTLAFGGVGPIIVVNYLALEVFYCEENRVLFGSRIYNKNTVSDPLPMIYGVNGITLVSPTSQSQSNNVLAAGDYTVTVSQGSMGDNVETLANFGPTAELNALREIYSMPAQPGVEISIPFPLDESILNKEFSVTDTVVLPQLSLHTSGAAVTLTEPHPYGRQAVAQVYGSISATQDVYDASVGGTSTYPWVRFYARRWGDTTIPLTLTLTTSPSSTVSITPTEFDELETLVDGWKEVSLQFTTPPTLGALNPGIFQWTAVGETAGNRWEVLGAAAPALSGIVGNYYNLAPSAQQLGTATYQPPSGSTIELTWMPNGVTGPAVSGATADQGTDAVILLSQNPPDVSGFAVTTLCQPLSGIGQQCDVDPCCIPSAVYFNQISWTSLSSPPSSGFGFYELQRSDTVDSEWQTIMEASAITGSSFNDFEARVGIDTSYRIRAVNLYGFYGDWSDEITATISEPGVTIGCRGDGHLLIFTSNENQCGEYSLAYSNAWESGQTVVEDFTFPESSFTQLQAMYDRDYFTAFRPTERGGEQFQRQILVQAAAISPPTLGDFQSLRDMAWDNVNYVCVRDEAGNRWFANVIVPSGRVMRNRNIYLAPVQIREVTATPTPVDPTECSSLGEVCEDPFTCDEVVGLDLFNRSVTGGWGEADEGGDWESGE